MTAEGEDNRQVRVTKGCSTVEFGISGLVSASFASEESRETVVCGSVECSSGKRSCAPKVKERTKLDEQEKSTEGTRDRPGSDTQEQVQEGKKDGRPRKA